LDVEWVWLPVVVLEGLGDLIEVPLLGIGVLSPSLQPNVVGTVALSNSLHGHSWSDVEWSVDVEPEFFIETLSSNLISFVNVDNLPSLVGIFFIVTISIVDNDGGSFFILRWCYFKNLVVSWINKEFTVVLEYLEPSWVCAPDLHISGFSSALDVPWLVVVSSPDWLWNLVEIPSLCFSSVGGLDNHVPVIDHIKVSSTW
jgi:hypothetical protein